MGNAKWRAAIGLGNAAGPKVTAGPDIYALCETANIEGTPVLSERINNFDRRVLGIDQYGHDFAFRIEGWEANCEHVGKLFFWLLGKDAISGAGPYVHTLTHDPANPLPPYFVTQIDDLVDKGTSQETEELQGCRLGALSIEFPEKSFAKVSVSGVGTQLGTPLASLTAVLPTGANEGPLSWAAVQGVAGGGFKIGYDGSATAADNDVKSIKIDCNTPATPQGTRLGDNQPGTINLGLIECVIEVTREFVGTTALDNYNAWVNQQRVDIDIKAEIGAHSVEWQIPHMVVNSPFRGEVGNSEESIMATGSFKAHLDPAGSDEYLTVIATDNQSAAYST
jgi:hypothetical protein